MSVGLRVSNVLKDQQAKLCIEALLGMIRFDPVSGKWSPDFDKIRPLAEQLGCFDHAGLNHVLGLINSLSSVFGADAKFINAYDTENTALPEMSVSITKELSKQLIEQQTQLYPKTIKSISRYFFNPKIYHTKNLYESYIITLMSTVMAI